MSFPPLSIVLTPSQQTSLHCLDLFVCAHFWVVCSANLDCFYTKTSTFYNFGLVRNQTWNISVWGIFYTPELKFQLFTWCKNFSSKLLSDLNTIIIGISLKFISPKSGNIPLLCLATNRVVHVLYPTLFMCPYFPLLVFNHNSFWS